MTEAPKVEQELLPCPFCGAADGRIEQAYVRATDDFAIWTVECVDCGADISDDESQTAADRHWNTRATLTEPERTAKAVAETVAAERERCARIAEMLNIGGGTLSSWVNANESPMSATQRHIASAIRDEGAGV